MKNLQRCIKINVEFKIALFSNLIGLFCRYAQCLVLAPNKIKKENVEKLVMQEVLRTLLLLAIHQQKSWKTIVKKSSRLKKRSNWMIHLALSVLLDEIEETVQ